MRFLLSCFAALLLSSCSESGADKAESSAAGKGPPVTAPAGGSAAAASGTFKPMTFENTCGVNVRPKEDSSSKPMLHFNAILRGKDADEDELVKVRGSCDYTPPGSPEIGTAGGLKPGWRCDSEAYQMDTGVRTKRLGDPTKVPAYDSVWLPRVIARDMRGYGAEDWYGKKPAPQFEQRDIVLDAFSIQGPGQLRFICPMDIENGGLFYDMKGCRVSWRHVLQPEKLYFHGTCGDTVEVPGLYVAIDPNPQ